jgi:hypothetical protein
MKHRCNTRDHVDKPMKRGSARVQCTKCGDVFPCRHDCEHLDCIVATGRELPDWVGDHDKAREALHAELMIIAPTVLTGAPMRKRAKRVLSALPEAA